MSEIKKSIRNLIRQLGFDLVRYEPKTHPLARRKKILDTYNINLVLDVGANIGQYGKQLREIGYKKKIVSFEPLKSAYDLLSDNAEKDKLWEIHNFALGDKEESAIINIAANSFSSSLLEMLPSHIKSAPNSKYVGHENIQVRTLDSVYPKVASQTDKAYLKIDTQGFEENVLKGAENSLNYIDTIQLEMSLTPLYRDEPLFDEMYQFLFQKGYTLISIETGFSDEQTGQLLQFDGIFHRI
ncbi:FkbM family methyltransferase [Pseudomonadota bacterium]